MIYKICQTQGIKEPEASESSPLFLEREGSMLAEVSNSQEAQTRQMSFQTYPSTGKSNGQSVFSTTTPWNRPQMTRLIISSL